MTGVLAIWFSVVLFGTWCALLLLLLLSLLLPPQLFWKPAELNVGPCIFLTLTLHGCSLTLMIWLSEGKITSVIGEKKKHLRKVKLSQQLQTVAAISKSSTSFQTELTIGWVFPGIYVLQWVEWVGRSDQRPLKWKTLLADDELFSEPCLPRPKLRTCGLDCPTMQC